MTVCLLCVAPMVKHMMCVTSNLSFCASLVGPKAPSSGEGRCADDNQHRPVSWSNAGHSRLLLDYILACSHPHRGRMKSMSLLYLSM